MVLVDIFGFSIRRKQQINRELDGQSFVTKEDDDGAVIVSPSGAYGTYVDLDGAIKSEADLVSKYREMTNHPEVSSAIDEIVNESINTEEKEIVRIILDDLPIEDQVKEAIIQEYKNILLLLEFSRKAYDIFFHWYVDGRIYFHIVIDKTRPELGIQQLRYIDPRRIRKIREVEKVKPKDGSTPRNENGSIDTMSVTKAEYYIYNEKGFNNPTSMGASATGASQVGTSTGGMKIAPDSIAYVPSGLTDASSRLVLGYLHKAIKPLNQLRTLEDATVIYRLSRAPERRVWYIDVGNLPKQKAEQQMMEIITRHKNKLVYDASTGDIRDDRKFMTMLEDFWLPRRGDAGRGTEVTTLPAGQNLGQIDDVLYFKKKLYGSLNVPVRRLDSETSFTVGHSQEMTREELKFGKFISRLRTKFTDLFMQILEKQLVLKGVTDYDTWRQLAPMVRFDFARDNYFNEIKNNEIMMGRLELLAQADPWAGKYYSWTTLQKKVLQMTDEDIEDESMLIREDILNPQFAPPPAPTGEDEDPSEAPNALIHHSAGGNPGRGSGGSASPSDGGDDTHNKLVAAKAIYQRLKGKQNKTNSEKKQLHSATQIVAKNKGKA